MTSKKSIILGIVLLAVAGAWAVSWHFMSAVESEVFDSTVVDSIDTPGELSATKIIRPAIEQAEGDTIQEYEMDFDEFKINMEYSVTAKDYSAFEDFALMMQNSYLINKPCTECRQLFVDILKSSSADIEFRVLAMEALSRLADTDVSQQLVDEFITQLIAPDDSASGDPTSTILVHEFKNTLLNSDSDINIKALVDYYVGKPGVLNDNPLSLMDAESREMVEQQISSMLNEHYDRELITTVLRDSFLENSGGNARSQLMNLDYPELFVELAALADKSGLTSNKEFYINHIYQNLLPDNALRGILGLSARNLETPEILYQKTNQWAQQNVGTYSDAYDEIFMNYHDEADRSLKSVAIALAGNLYDDDKAKSILYKVLGEETDPFIRKMIDDELSRLNDNGKS